MVVHVYDRERIRYHIEHIGPGQTERNQDGKMEETRAPVIPGIFISSSFL